METVIIGLIGFFVLIFILLIIHKMNKNKRLLCNCGCNEMIMPGEVSVSFSGTIFKYGHIVQSYSLALKKPTTFTCGDLITDETQLIKEIPFSGVEN